MSCFFKKNPYYFLILIFLITLFLRPNILEIILLTFVLATLFFMIKFNKFILNKLSSSTNLFEIDYEIESLKLIKNNFNIVYLIISSILIFYSNSLNEDSKSIIVWLVALSGGYYNLLFIVSEKILLILKFRLSEIIEINKLEKYLSIVDLLKYVTKNNNKWNCYDYFLDKNIILILNNELKV